jgi:hypothetical protein
VIAVQERRFEPGSATWQKKGAAVRRLARRHLVGCLKK